MSDNSVTLIGNLTRDPELRFTQGGTGFATFGLAVNRRWQKDGEWQEKVSFVDIVCWGKLAENVAETMQKGFRAVVVGRFEMNEWEKDGQKRTKIEVIADEVAPGLKWATAVVTKATKDGGNFGPTDREEPWGSSSKSTAAGGGASYQDDEEPF